MDKSTLPDEPCCDEFGPLLGRRRLFELGAVLLAGGALAAIGGAVGAAAGTGTAAGPAGAGVGTTLQDFLTFSALLTGVTGLDTSLAQSYLTALSAAPQDAMRLAGLEQAAGIGSDAPPTLAALTAAGFFDRPDAGTLADAVLTAWYSGTVPTDSGPSTLTYTGALAWSKLGFTRAPSICGGAFGFWSQAPDAT